MKIKLTLDATPIMGKQISFIAPCGSVETEALVINDVEYTICDAKHRNLCGLAGIWNSGAVVSVILNTERERAYIQNQAVLNKPKAGFIYPLATTTVPDGFLPCDGAEYLREDYPELFAAIGTLYGEGDGETTFNVPDLQTRVPVGAGGAYDLGQTGGEEYHKLTIDEMPNHGHRQRIAISGYNQWADYVTPSTASALVNVNNTNQTQSSNPKTDAEIIYDLYGGHTFDVATIDANATTQGVGGDQPHNNMQPYTVVNYIIATGKDTAVSVADIVLGAQAIPLDVKYGGTGATNAQQARKNLELGCDLLWQNAAGAGASQPDQTIDLGDVSKYKEYIVQTYNHGQFRSDLGRYIHMGYSNIYANGSNAVFYTRGACLHASGEFQISVCMGWNKNKDDIYKAPQQIVIEAVFGIKEVV